MDRSAELERAKRRHRSRRSRRGGSGESLFTFLTLVLVAASLASIAVCTWAIRTGQVELRVSAPSFVEEALSNTGAMGLAARSVLLGESDLSISGQRLVLSVLPNAEPEAGDADAHGAGEPSIEILPVVESVRGIVTSGVTVNPLEVISSQLPRLGIRLASMNSDESNESLTTASLQLLPLSDLKPVSSAWLVRSEGPVAAGIKPDSTARASTRYGRQLDSVAAIGKPAVRGLRTSPSLLQPAVVGNTLVYGPDPVVAIYHTHSSEAYQASQGAAYLWGSKEGVISIGQVLAETLWMDYGISVVHSQAFHDVEEFRNAYSRSAATVEAMVKRYRNLKLVLDIHRDATGNDSGQTVTINGMRTAQVLILVTTDKYGLPHPNWYRNLAVAQQLHSVISSLYPGLSRGVRQHDDGRFNQHLHPGCLLLEIGDVNNAKEEATSCAALLAHAIAVSLSR